MSKVQRVRTRVDDRERVALIEAPRMHAREVTAKRLAIDQFHRQEPGVAIAVDVEYPNDVGMRQRLRLPEFPLQALDLVRIVAQWFAQHLESDQRVAAQITRTKYDAITAAANLLLQNIAIVNRRSGHELRGRDRCLWLGLRRRGCWRS